MNLFLCSSGFTTSELADRFAMLLSKPKDQVSFGVVPNAMSLEPGSKSWFISEVNCIVKYFSDNIDFVDLEALPKNIWLERLNAVDIIYFTGGENEPLFTTMESTGFNDYSEELFKTKVFIGTSAGAMVTGHRLTKSAYEHIYGPVGTLANYGLTNYLNLFDGCFIPHLNSPDFKGRNKQLIDEVADLTEQDIYAVDEYSAIIVNDNYFELFGNIYQPNR